MQCGTSAVTAAKPMHPVGARTHPHLRERPAGQTPDRNLTLGFLWFGIQMRIVAKRDQMGRDEGRHSGPMNGYSARNARSNL